MNGFSLVLNLFHIGIIYKSMGRKINLYYKIIISVSIVDMLDAVKFMVKFNCGTRQLVVSNIYMAAAALVFQEFSSYSRIIVLTLAFFDRWLVLARPYQYEDSKFVQFFWLFLTLPCLLLITLLTIKSGTSIQKFCFHMYDGIKHCNTLIGKIFFCYWLHTLMLICHTTFLVITLRELRKMRQRSNLTSQDTLTRKATITIIAIMISYYLSFLSQPFIWLIVKIPGIESSAVQSVSLVDNLFISMYGMLNVVIYGVMTKGYRAAIKKLFCKSQVTPVIE
ncbi:hypothetical protein EB796_019022 [Bugula neritina]|uniref:G-protein coupled receptors family 1 profile domain-containing protein n=1 Tax=Bugula neritina TaxID=10212 RepID=A0A7J7JAL8_BUGNE|nr:hypothetical protein EB796_019022 [Bugula neritina]